MRGLKLGLGFSSPAAAGASEFTPASIASLVSWHDATDAATISATGGGLVDSWTDKSGNGNTFTSTTTSRPTTAARTQNGLNVLDFDGGDHMVMSSFGATESQVNTLYIAGVFDSTAGSQYMVDGIDLLNRNGLLITASNFTALSGSFLIHSAADTLFHIFKVVYNSTSSIIGVDGSDVSGNAGTQGTNGLTIGKAYNLIFPMNGAIGEVLFFNAALSAGDEANLVSYLSRWGV